MCFFRKKSPQEKARWLEKKGDLCFAKGKFHKAYHFYHEAVELDETLTPLYDKLIALLKEQQEDWQEEHFAHSLFWEMRKKEIQDPTFKRIHARSEPESQAITKLVKKMLEAPSQEEETKCIEEVAAYGPQALYPLLDFILAFKEAGKKQK